jgi:hypothetical protein
MVKKPRTLAAEFCIVTERLIHGKTLVLSSVEYDDTQEHGTYFSIYDLGVLQAGKQRPLFEHTAGEGYIPFLYLGKKTRIAIADFDRSGRIGFALPYRFDTGSALMIHAWDPASAAFKEVAHLSHESSEDNSFDISGDVIRISKCRGGWRNREGIFPIIETYKLSGQRWVLDHDEADPKGKSGDGECSIFSDPRLK